MTKEANFDLVSSTRDWYGRAVNMEFRVTWQQVDRFKHEIPHLQFIRCQTAFIDSDTDDLHIRRKAAMALAGSVLAPDGGMDAELQNWWGLIGVETCSNRIADTICTLYDEAPTRTFHTKPEINTAFEELYKEFDVNTAMQRAYRYALFTNIVLLWPDFENKTIKVLTPDHFRLEGIDDKIHRVWIITYNAKNEIEYQAWSDDKVTLYDSKGKELGAREQPNPYGRIPGTFLKLNPSNDLYGSGMSEAAEINAWSNVVGFLATRISVFQSYSVALATNLKLKQGTKLGPGYVLEASNMGGDPSQNPDLKFITPDGKFLELEQHRRNRIKSFEHANGLPGFMDEMAGTPPTGIALTVLERPLNKKRKQHQFALVKAERDFAELLGTVVEKQSSKMGVVRRLPIDATFAVSYVKPATFTEPSNELEHDLKLMEYGFISPTAIAQKYLGMTGVSDQDAVTEINKNKALFAGTYVEPTVPTPVINP
jgi:hypothetical protein